MKITTNIKFSPCRNVAPARPYLLNPDSGKFKRFLAHDFLLELPNATLQITALAYRLIYGVATIGFKIKRDHAISVIYKNDNFTFPRVGQNRSVRHPNQDSNTFLVDIIDYVVG